MEKLLEVALLVFIFLIHVCVLAVLRFVLVVVRLSSFAGSSLLERGCIG